MRRALAEYEVIGIQTTIRFFQRVLEHPDFVAGRIHTGFIDRVLAEGLLEQLEPSQEAERVAMLVSVLAARRRRAEPASTVSSNSAWKIEGREALLNRWPVRGTRGA